ncbi:orotidine-5'-phosphate decarboxylase [Criibacterium bergeronii]|uniref:Orotidine 5'-phosphate decarboxylase n=1 Tax=Criibacterium bergeronii TaxID=1871336 RepID=A0A371IJW1_9FIRM|nr:orotidine-5'-phosphate decarboxylase [Criibacterium bergeronii]MBS6063307.1 orotidine-5'-phosphate decarboxylase [Peptostreptococcaceae bacterium]RDY20782.1 orotidine-5'-phosphate decarboxylase [Criibacterium bergeronii]TRW26088.1 orotidine-5'-phosphate decarboxylase [Criibacterium bergeronii]
MIIDKLYEQVQKKGPLCVGLDTDLSYIPEFMKSQKNITEAVFEFNKNIIDLTKEFVAIYKPQIAYYEALGLDGLKAFKMTLDYLKQNNCLVVSDVKRSDIAATAKMYAKAFFDGEFESDFVTLNPYMGYDSLDPYFEYFEKKDKGIFVLVRTSNPGSKDIQLKQVGDEYLYQKIGQELTKIGKRFNGKYGYSRIGFVIGATHNAEAVDIRNRFSHTFFLVPGYGAQGATGKDARLLLNKDENGAIINSSRGIIAKSQNTQNQKEFDDKITELILKMKEDLNN